MSARQHERLPGRAGSPRLNARLVLVTVIVLAVGLAVADAAAYLGLRRHLADQADRTLGLMLERLELMLDDGAQRIDVARLQGSVPSDVRVVFLDATGAVIAASTPSLDELSLSEERMAKAPAGTSQALGSAGAHMRALVVDLAAGDELEVVHEGTAARAARVVIAIPEDDARAALRSLVVTELLVAVVVLLAGVAVAGRAVAVGLRPLRAMTTSAQRIARGHRSERLVVDDGHGEMSELARVLNDAFETRATSEQRMREFVADASHELRTPLSIIHGWADLHAEGGVTDWSAVEEAMTDIRLQSTHMARLVDDLLILARLDHADGDRREPVRGIRIDLSRMARDVLDQEAARHPEHVAVWAGGVAPLVVGDPEALRRCLVNLVGNAFTHTAPGSRVEVRCAPGAGAGMVTVEVRDDGNGLPVGTHERAFDRFWRADLARSSRGGTGLGLAIAREVARSLGGDVTLAPRSPRGTIATVRLPAAAGHEAAALE